ncbi:MAG: sugar ABC transporter ATP-binding protein [Pirellulaceae bacterium]|nr:sugar ABC transporter ATP-binding protein [Pirellulaceae bacterium]
MNAVPLIQLRSLSKSYVGVHALRNLTFDIAAGEVHAVCGENGAGKSTLIRLLTGVVSPDEGEILVQGERLRTGHVQSSEDAGIAVMHQESSIFPDLNAIDNIFVGREITWCNGWLLDRAGMRKRTQELLDRLGASIDLETPVGELSLAQQQMVALARALSRECRLLIMDEPTASLSAKETETLLNIVRQLRADGVSILYVSHRLEEVFAISDRVTVLRDGQYVSTSEVNELDVEIVIQLMVGRSIESVPRTELTTKGKPMLEVEQLTRAGAFQAVTFSVHRGEVVGLAGLVGSGRSEIARAIFGIDPFESGAIRVDGQPLSQNSVKASMAAGIALVPEDRQHEGLVLEMTVAENLSLAKLPAICGWGFVIRHQEAALVNDFVSRLSIKAASPQVAAETLSGGNQQKIVLGKWLAQNPKVLILDEPTRGVDVGAKSQVHQIVRELSKSGMATLVISSEMPELLALCDRLLVIREGRIVGELACASATQEEVLALALPDAGKEAKR